MKAQELNSEPTSMRIILGSFKERISKLGHLNEDEDLDDGIPKNNRNGVAGLKNRIRLNNLPWDLIRLNDAQFFYLRAKLFKFVVMIFLNLVFFLLLIVKFNCCGFKIR